jgi:hypothetical protein
LPGRKFNAPGFFQMLLGLLVTGLVGSFQTHQARQGGRAASFQSQGRIGRGVPFLLARMIVIVPFQGEEAEDAVEGQRHPPLALPAGFGLVSRIDAVGSLLQQISHQLVGRLKNRRSHQHLQLLDGHPVGLGGLETRHQLLDFLLLGQADGGREFFGLAWGFFFRRDSTGRGFVQSSAARTAR